MVDFSFLQPQGTGTVLAGEPGNVPYYLARPKQPEQSNNDLTALGMTASIAGSLIGAVGAAFSAEAQKEQLKSQALNAEFAARMAELDARQADDDAMAILAAGRDEIGRLTLAAGQRKAKLKVSAAARGVVGNVGSAAEVLASEDIVKEQDVNKINANTIRAAGQARVRGVNAQNRSLLAGVSAGNLRRTAGTIRPVVAFSNSSLASAGQFADTYAGSQ